MALKTADVVNTLNDFVTQGMFFWVGPVYVNAYDYRSVRDNILSGNIMVVEGGKDQTLAFYNDGNDVLTTQNATSPPTLEQRALLLHECTHAMVDFANNNSVTRHMDELAAYTAQLVYTLRSNPGWTLGADDGPWPHFFHSLFDLAKANSLDTVAGNGNNLSQETLEPIRVQLAALPAVNYGDYSKDTRGGADGVRQYGPYLRAFRKGVSGV
jgi:hypothetical protein